jgi:hypothetical protein
MVRPVILTGGTAMIGIPTKRARQGRSEAPHKSQQNNVEPRRRQDDIKIAPWVEASA